MGRVSFSWLCVFSIRSMSQAVVDGRLRVEKRRKIRRQMILAASE